MTESDAEKRQKILKFLNSEFKKDPTGFIDDETIAEKCNLDKTEVKGICILMEDEGLIKLVEAAGEYRFYNIKSKGVRQLQDNVVENPMSHKSTPFGLNATNAEIRKTMEEAKAKAVPRAMIGSRSTIIQQGNASKPKQRIAGKLTIKQIVMIIITAITVFGGSAVAYNFNVNINSPHGNSITSATQSGDNNINVGGSNNKVQVSLTPSEKCIDGESGLTYTKCDLDFQISRPNQDWSFDKNISYAMTTLQLSIPSSLMGGIIVESPEKHAVSLFVLNDNGSQSLDLTQFVNLQVDQFKEKVQSCNCQIIPTLDKNSILVKVDGNFTYDAQFSMKEKIEKYNNKVYVLTSGYVTNQPLSNQELDGLEKTYQSFSHLK